MSPCLVFYSSFSWHINLGEDDASEEFLDGGHMSEIVASSTYSKWKLEWVHCVVPHALYELWKAIIANALWVMANLLL